MSAWFLATSLGNLIAGLLAGEVSGEAVGQMSGQFLQLVWLPVGAGLALLLLARPIMNLTVPGSGSPVPSRPGAEHSP